VKQQALCLEVAKPKHRALAISRKLPLQVIIPLVVLPYQQEYVVNGERSSALIPSKSEYHEQQEIERFALSLYPEATGVKEIQPFLMTDETTDAWLVILTTTKAFEFITTLVTTEDLTKASQ